MLEHILYKEMLYIQTLQTCNRKKVHLDIGCLWNLQGPDCASSSTQKSISSFDLCFSFKSTQLLLIISLVLQDKAEFLGHPGSAGVGGAAQGRSKGSRPGSRSRSWSRPGSRSRSSSWSRPRSRSRSRALGLASSVCVPILRQLPGAILTEQDLLQIHSGWSGVVWEIRLWRSSMMMRFKALKGNMCNTFRLKHQNDWNSNKKKTTQWHYVKNN